MVTRKKFWYQLILYKIVYLFTHIFTHKHTSYKMSLRRNLFLSSAVIAGVVAFTLHRKSIFNNKDKMEEWVERSKKWGYEGAAAVVTNDKNEIMFLISTNKDGKQQAEIPGGKPEEVDNANPFATAIREVKEECGLDLTEDMFDTKSMLFTTGGTTGVRSIQLVTFPLPSDVHKPTKREKFDDIVWGRIHRSEDKVWTVRSNDSIIPIRKFNTFFFEQNKDKLGRFMYEQ